jgi:hypothetical protein
MKDFIKQQLSFLERSVFTIPEVATAIGDKIENKTK